MKVSALFAFVATAVTVTSAESFSAEDQAIWIDRHNYFRTTGLPWSAGNMYRIGWDAKLSTKAASTASGCSAKTGSGVNVYQSTKSSNSSSILDEAIQSWVVETSVQTLPKLMQPDSDNFAIGAGTYNSYSQVVWASTKSVGCAHASCPSGHMVVCEYSPAGNDGSSAWYVHDSQGSECPVGTSSSNGLCIVDGDAANDPIAPIPAGEQTYEVYSTYVPDIKSIILEAARNAGKSSTPPTGSSSSSNSAPSLQKSSSGTKQSSTSPKKSDTKPSPKHDSFKATNTPATTPSSKPGSSTKQSSDGSLSPGKVKASTDTGSAFANQATSSSKEATTSKTTEQKTETDPPATTSPTTESTTQNTAATPDTKPSTSVSALTESSAPSSGAISAAGVAGIGVMAVVGVAAIGVVLSYRKNEKRQREIMRDGGIVVI
ncbi:hypothetical protein BBO99_00006415 [Phytophthora kernoviae]|uniref:SCP domain-containing protein n=2 Tax=Phytophthora kernoviae TaxID=325452 RepID=A0A3R7J6K6_9STRA|nr:hypothetical protein G195_007569 [Phytophthora kernoviae 00238/432]KAG2521708.1 hypothetical protein JM16_006142 [Phytophthora kernoviae]RLN31350.1 hypothetical protein BBI17_006485 [Phytophthora kernoviae]RLN77853.1 hypothetical protein BBO99_00006415 [Phytophthora kernoviae]